MEFEKSERACVECICVLTFFFCVFRYQLSASINQLFFEVNSDAIV